MDNVGKLLVAMQNNDVVEMGMEIGRLYTDHGIPLDIALEKIEADNETKLAILHGACRWFMEHKRRSGATEKSLERQRTANRGMLNRFIETGEVGIY